VIIVTVIIDGGGIIKSVRVAGHALGLQKGGNIVCAAATVLVRTAARMLEAEDGVLVTGGPGARGEFALDIKSVNHDKTDFVKTTGNYLLQGIRDLMSEFPEDCSLKVEQRR